MKVFFDDRFWFLFLHFHDVDNTIQENSSIFSLIRMRWLPNGKDMRAVKLCTSKTWLANAG